MPNKFRPAWKLDIAFITLEVNMVKTRLSDNKTSTLSSKQVRSRRAKILRFFNYHHIKRSRYLPKFLLAWISRVLSDEETRPLLLGTFPLFSLHWT